MQLPLYPAMFLSFLCVKVLLYSVFFNCVATFSNNELLGPKSAEFTNLHSSSAGLVEINVYLKALSLEHNQMRGFL